MNRWSTAVIGGLAALALLAGCAPAPQPVISIAQPGQCIRPAAEMRRTHPDLLRHQRDLTVHQGARGMPASLSACVECHAPHASPNPAATDVQAALAGSAVNSPGGFCDSCHAYVGVKLDCFECHAGTPGHGATQQAAAALPRNVQ